MGMHLITLLNMLMLKKLVQEAKRLLEMKMHVHHDGFKPANVNLLVRLKEEL